MTFDEAVLKKERLPDTFIEDEIGSVKTPTKGKYPDYHAVGCTTR